MHISITLAVPAVGVPIAITGTTPRSDTMNGCCISPDLRFLSCGASRHEPRLPIQGNVGFMMLDGMMCSAILFPEYARGLVNVSTTLSSRLSAICRSPVCS
jgi:hypothetical protein